MSAASCVFCDSCISTRVPRNAHPRPKTKSRNHNNKFDPTIKSVPPVYLFLRRINLQTEHRTGDGDGNVGHSPGPSPSPSLCSDAYVYVPVSKGRCNPSQRKTSLAPRGHIQRLGKHPSASMRARAQEESTEL
ncbi:hypothetical protein TRVL_09854 [Trypanosoma vivax]|nr:hypothetical protein TRVL_09854 [Trypanosoma vivax]